MVYMYSRMTFKHYENIHKMLENILENMSEHS